MSTHPLLTRNYQDSIEFMSWQGFDTDPRMVWKSDGTLFIVIDDGSDSYSWGGRIADLAKFARNKPEASYDDLCNGIPSVTFWYPSFDREPELKHGADEALLKALYKAFPECIK